jgi:putative acetyltransferase
MKIRHFKTSDAKDIADLFHRSVHAISTDVYSPEQLEAWSPSPPDYTMWTERLEKIRPFVATIEGVVIGFIELEPDGHIDCLYVHPDYQGQGVAKTLFNYAKNVAIENGCQTMYVEASKIAKSFFLKMGFEIQAENRVIKNDQALINYSMSGSSKR